MDASDRICMGEIGDRARDTQHADIAARGQAHRIGGLHQQFAPRLVGLGEAVERIAVEFGIAACAACFEAGRLTRASGAHACGNLGAALGWRGQGEIGCADGIDLDMQIDPVEHGAGHARLVIGRAARRTAAGKRRIAEMAAAARVHRRDQLDARRKRHMRIGASNIDFAGLQRLPQRIEHRALEFRHYVADAPNKR